ESSRHARFNHRSVETKGLIPTGAHEGGGRLRSFPTFNSAFTFNGATFPFTMVGHNPARGGEVEVDTAFIMLSFVFDEFLDAQGNNVVINSGDIVDDVARSPNFVATRYT